MSINQKSTHFYQLDDHILQQFADNPYLGVTLSDDMKWNSHINKITKKANSTLGFFEEKFKALSTRLQKNCLTVTRQINFGI